MMAARPARAGLIGAALIGTNAFTLVDVGDVADGGGVLTGLWDITGGPFNPFIVMYVTYVGSLQ